MCELRVDLDVEKLEIREFPGGVQLTVKVVPGASRTKIAGVWGNALKVAVSAPPERGRANEAVIALVARALGVKRADVAIVSGQTQAVKHLAVSGLSPARVRQNLAAL